MDTTYEVTDFYHILERYTRSPYTWTLVPFYSTIKKRINWETYRLLLGYTEQFNRHLNLMKTESASPCNHEANRVTSASPCEKLLSVRDVNKTHTVVPNQPDEIFIFVN